MAVPDDYNIQVTGIYWAAVPEFKVPSDGPRGGEGVKSVLTTCAKNGEMLFSQKEAEVFLPESEMEREEGKSTIIE